jgi:hypothetical protein
MKDLRAVAGLAVAGAALTMVPTAVQAEQFDHANRWMAKRFERVAVPEVRYADQPKRSKRTKRKRDAPGELAPFPGR